MGARASSGEKAAEPVEKIEPSITLKVLTIDGEVLLDSRSLAKANAVRTLRRDILESRQPCLPQGVTLLLADGAELKDGDDIPDGVAEVSAVFHSLELTDKQRKQDIDRLDKAGYGGLAFSEFRRLSSVAKADKDVIYKAVRMQPECIKHANEIVRQDREFMLKVLNADPRTFRYFPNELTSDRDLAIKAVDRDYTNLQWCSSELKDDQEIVAMALSHEGMLLKHASDNLKNNKEIVKLAVGRSREALKFASTALQEDEEVLAALKPEREMTEMERLLQESLKQQQAMGIFRDSDRRQQQEDHYGVQYRPTTFEDRVQLANSGGMGFSQGLRFG